jgi:hypothetical protein
MAALLGTMPKNAPDPDDPAQNSTSDVPTGRCEGRGLLPGPRAVPDRRLSWSLRPSRQLSPTGSRATQKSSQPQAASPQIRPAQRVFEGNKLAYAVYDDPPRPRRVKVVEGSGRQPARRQRDGRSLEALLLRARRLSPND